MDWKAEAIEKLRDYEARRKALDSIPLELERLAAAYVGIRSAKLDGTPTTKGSSNRREDDMLSNIVHRDELKRRLKDARLWVKIVDGGLSVLDDEERLVLDLCFIHKVKGSIVSVKFSRVQKHRIRGDSDAAPHIGNQFALHSAGAFQGSNSRTFSGWLRSISAAVDISQDK